MTEQRTDPPPAPDARAMRAIGRELDTLGELVGELSAGVSALVEMGETDARTLARVEGKIDSLIELLTGPESGLVARVGSLEMWRGEHAREHVRQ